MALVASSSRESLRSIKRFLIPRSLRNLILYLTQLKGQLRKQAQTTDFLYSLVILPINKWHCHHYQKQVLTFSTISIMDRILPISKENASLKRISLFINLSNSNLIKSRNLSVVKMEGCTPMHKTVTPCLIRVLFKKQLSDLLALMVIKLLQTLCLMPKLPLLRNLESLEKQHQSNQLHSISSIENIRLSFKSTLRMMSKLIKT